jgi:hypothetical protein
MADINNNKVFHKSLKGKYYQGDLGVNGSILLKWAQRNSVRMWTGYIWKAWWNMIPCSMV